jgi:hypothetical protein
LTLSANAPNGSRRHSLRLSSSLAIAAAKIERESNMPFKLNFCCGSAA